MSADIIVIKRNGKQEPYSHQKLQTSIYRTCRSVHSAGEVAETITHQLSQEILNWISDKTEVTSKDIREKVNSCMPRYHPDAATIYAYAGAM